MEDAAACNARLRKLEILEIFPIINDAYQQKTEKQQEQMKWTLASISMLSFFLLLAIFYVYKQMKRLAVARKEVIDTNKRLKELNEELHLSMHKLKEANHSIAENSYLKEEYIGRYMDQCSVYGQLPPVIR
jgi:cell division protein FtsL